MRVLHIITGLENGGAESTLFRLTVADIKNQHVVISLTDMGVYGERLLQAGIRVETLGMKRGRISPISILKLALLIRFIKADAIQTWMYHADLIGGIAGRIAGIKAIAWGVRNSTLDPATTSLSSRLVVKICALISKIIPRKIVSCSTNARTTHIDLGYASSDFVVIPNGYDLKKLFPSEDLRIDFRRKWACADDDIILGVVARWDAQKDHANLVHALNKIQLPHIKCMLIGTNMSQDNHQLVKMVGASKHANSIYLMGTTSEIPSVMNALDLHILPSAYGEAFPNVLAEAMACGTPCIATDVGDASFIVGETGWIIPPSNSDALAHAIEIALQEIANSDTWRLRQEACTQRVTENFSIEKMVQSYNQVWQELLNKGN